MVLIIRDSMLIVVIIIILVVCIVGFFVFSSFTPTKKETKFSEASLRNLSNEELQDLYDAAFVYSTMHQDLSEEVLNNLKRKTGCETHEDASALFKVTCRILNERKQW